MKFYQKYVEVPEMRRSRAIYGSYLVNYAVNYNPYSLVC
jgi:hypothetical protein